MHAPSVFHRWWTYQQERFPIMAHGPLIAAFSLSAVIFSALLRGQVSLPDWRSMLVAFGSAFCFFLQLRIADEFKDYEEDCRFRPYRPVPRGLISLRELGVAGGLSMGLQLGLALWLEPALLPLLLLTWGYLALMSKEFFIPAWLKAHPTFYMLSHMLIMPLIDLYVTACDWLVSGQGWHWGGSLYSGLGWFLLLSFFNGLVIEIGRKIRAPIDEEAGVETYSVLWGTRKAALVWVSAMLITAIGAWFAAHQIEATWLVSGILTLLLIAAALVALRFSRRPITPRARQIEAVAGAWTLLLYLSLGPLPLLLQSLEFRVVVHNLEL